MPPSRDAARAGTRVRIGLLLVVLAALVVRGLYLAERVGEPDVAHPAIDARWHDYHARSLAGLPVEAPAGYPEGELGRTPYLRPPGYPWFLAGVLRATGGSPRAPLVANHLLGLLALGLLFRLGRRWGGPWGGPWVGVAAALVFALQGTVVFFEGELHAPALVTVVVLAGLEGLVAAGERERTGVGGAGVRRALAGLALGAAAVTRPNALLPIALMGLAEVLRTGARGDVASADGSGDGTTPNAPGRARLRARLRAAGPLAAGVLLALVPSLVRNVRASGEPVLVTASAGLNLYLGNRPGAGPLIDSDLGELGRFRTCFDGPEVHRRLEAHVGRALTAREADAWFAREARAAIADDPDAFLARTAAKAGLLLGPREVAHNKDVAAELRASPVLRVLRFPFALLLGLALGGWVLRPAGRPDPESSAHHGADPDAVPAPPEAAAHLRRLTAVWALGWVLSVVPFFVASRYRAPLVPVLCLPAGALVVALVEAARRHRRAAGLALPVAVGVLVPGTIALLDRTPLDTAGYRAPLDAGIAWVEAGELERARAAFDEALGLAPDLATTRFHAALGAEGVGDDGAARAGYRAALEVDGAHGKAHARLAGLLLEAGDARAAAPHLVAALELEPTYPGLVESAPGAVLTLAAHPDAARRDGERALALARALEAATGAGDGRSAALAAASLAEAGRFPEAVAEADRGLALARAAGNAPAVAALERQRAGYLEGRPFRLGGD